MTRSLRMPFSASNAISQHRQDLLGETSKPFDFATRKDGKLTATVHVEQGYDVAGTRDASGHGHGIRRRTAGPRQIYYAARATPHGSGFRSWTGRMSTVAQSCRRRAASATLTTWNWGIRSIRPRTIIAFLQRDPDTLELSRPAAVRSPSCRQAAATARTSAMPKSISGLKSPCRSRV